MIDIQRYDVDVNYQWENWSLEEFESGDLVKYEDHAAIVAQLETELAAYQEREQWIHDNATTNGGGNGFKVTFFVPVDHEDIFCGISAAIKEQQ